MEIRVRVGAAIIKDGSVLLAKHRKGDMEYWLLPGGGVKPGETLDKALAREIKEELSLDIACGNILYVSDSINEESKKHILQIAFSCNHISGDLKVNPDHRLCDADYFTPEEIANLDLRPSAKEALIDYLNTGKRPSRAYLGNIWL